MIPIWVSFYFLCRHMTRFSTSLSLKYNQDSLSHTRSRRVYLSHKLQSHSLHFTTLSSPSVVSFNLPVMHFHLTFFIVPSSLTYIQSPLSVHAMYLCHLITTANLKYFISYMYGTVCNGSERESYGNPQRIYLFERRSAELK